MKQTIHATQTQDKKANKQQKKQNKTKKIYIGMVLKIDFDNNNDNDNDNEYSNLHKYDCFNNNDSNTTAVLHKVIQTQNTQKEMGLALNMSLDIDTNIKTNHTNGKLTLIFFFRGFYCETTFFGTHNKKQNVTEKN